MSLSIKGKLAQILALESGTSKAGKEWINTIPTCVLVYLVKIK